MTNSNEQAISADLPHATKAWAEPKLEKVEISSTATGTYAGGSLEDTFPAYPSS